MFQLNLGEVLEIHRVLFVPGMRVSKLSVPSFEDKGYGMMVRFGHVFLYRRDEPVGTTILLGDRRDKLYILRGHIVHPRVGGWLPDSEDGAGDALDRHVIYISSDEESGSLQSTGRDLASPAMVMMSN